MAVQKGQTIRRYDWDTLFTKDGRKKKGDFTLKRGKDYSCLTKTMETQIRMEGSKRGFSISIDGVTAQKDGTINVTFQEKQES